MALSNKFGWLVLTTGNKSEMSVGYTTLYGDLAGGFAVIKDVPKTLVYRLCEWRNSPAGASSAAEEEEEEEEGAPPRASSPIPASILARAPSAELRHDQRDADSLPPYDLLDRILHGYIELDHSREQLIADGLPEPEVDRTIRLVDLAEYKRRQAPPGIKVTTRAFGRDRRMPITNEYRSRPPRDAPPICARHARLHALRARPRGVRQHHPGSADPAQRAREPAARALPRLLAGRHLPRPADHRSLARPQRVVHRPVRRLPGRRASPRA